ncbi:hypothetical protein KAFR_0B04120 [Kazachstania africana CBS 2517]|uniref:Protein RTA1 n=1 Tax=Kazachstania africana (strain ATCC 22294 / BCRC 22015 / CBS 2517 / CECT 1963 / NBRC 1671 / NRRL Y-8276) TaxID=1071382 RepID=H2AQQ8_KAZAF|nr:hypothetical protein KAFR_0B04120 [Kazachstania africana CBS 2517]CCF56708.1 hypothetical protein KAFR_0B04120 [Kazachstania africana CBS 2517]
MTISNNGTDSSWQLYRYTPNKAAAGIFTALFIVATILSILTLYRCATKNKHTVYPSSSTANGFSLRFYSPVKLIGPYIPSIVGCALEVIGYIARCVSCNNQTKITPYVIQNVLVLIAPTLFAASIYMIFGRMSHLMFSENLMIMPARFNTTIFVLGDVVSLLMQAGGGGLMASESGRVTGSHVLTGGLFVQIIFFGLFIINEFLFLFKLSRKTNPISEKVNWKKLNIVLLFNSFLILLRSIIRVIEAIEGFDGYIQSHEWFLYIFDALLMFVLCVLHALIMLKANIFKIQEDSITAQYANIHITNSNNLGRTESQLFSEKFYGENIQTQEFGTHSSKNLAYE